jgi:2-dehydropantoate 2-reductase
MKIAVVGCGAVGSFYGAKLCRAGHQTHFLLRSDYDAVRRGGVSIRSVDGDFQVRPSCARHPSEIGPCDLVLIGLKTTANGEFPRLIPALVGQGTLVVTLQNGLGNEEKLAALLAPNQILGGLCFVCLNRVAPGVIVHTAHGHVVLGEFEGGPRARTQTLAAAFQRAAIPCAMSENLAATHWEKLTWNIPFNGLGVAGAAGLEAVQRGALAWRQPIGRCLATDRLLGDSRWESLLRELMWEVVQAARAKGYNLPDSVVNAQIERTRIMGAYRASTLIDFERGLPLEMESMFLEPLRQAQSAGVAAPRLTALCAVLGALEARRAEGPGAVVQHPCPRHAS